MNGTTISTPDLTDDHAGARALELQWRNFGGVAAFGGAAVIWGVD